MSHKKPQSRLNENYENCLDIGKSYPISLRHVKKVSSLSRESNLFDWNRVTL